MNKISTSQSRIQAATLINEIIAKVYSDDQVSEILLSLKKKKETADEILGFLDGLQSHAVKINIPAHQFNSILLDVCGTGGDGSGTFNVSTAVAFVLASAGVSVAKHGNRGVSSQSGSSDVLASLGTKSSNQESEVILSLEKYQLAFLFAPAFHPVLAQLSAVRKKLAVHTIFNALGPLLNPAPITHQLMGVYDSALLSIVGSVLKEKGLKEAMIVHGSDGLDEITLSGETQMVHLKNGKLFHFNVQPEDFGLKRAPLSEVLGAGPQKNAEILIEIFKGKKSAKRDLMIMNSAAALVLVGKAKSFIEGAKLAEQVVDSGKTLDLLNKMKKEST